MPLLPSASPRPLRLRHLPYPVCGHPLRLERVFAQDAQDFFYLGDTFNSQDLDRTPRDNGVTSRCQGRGICTDRQAAFIDTVIIGPADPFSSPMTLRPGA